ncbi:MAG: BsuBI/PstI family type II restriction endonuclease, partial [Terracidiphilus sp.]
MSKETRLKEARAILVDLGLPKAQQNERTALCLLALLDLTSGTKWGRAKSPTIGITPIMDWARKHYGKDYAPNTRETVRRQSMHQFVQAGICLYNPDKPDRPVNSPHAVYQIAPELLGVLRAYTTARYKTKLAAFLSVRKTLAEMYAKRREMAMIPVKVKEGTEIVLSAGEHSALIKQVVEEFSPRFVAGGRLPPESSTAR